MSHNMNEYEHFYSAWDSTPISEKTLNDLPNDQVALSMILEIIRRRA